MLPWLRSHSDRSRPGHGISNGRCWRGSMGAWGLGGRTLATVVIREPCDQGAGGGAGADQLRQANEERLGRRGEPLLLCFSAALLLCSPLLSSLLSALLSALLSSFLSSPPSSALLFFPLPSLLLSPCAAMHSRRNRVQQVPGSSDHCVLCLLEDYRPPPNTDCPSMKWADSPRTLLQQIWTLPRQNGPDRLWCCLR